VVSLDEYKTVEARRAAVCDVVGEYGADVVLECVGHPSAVPEGFELCRDGGKYLVLGQYANAGNVEFNPHIITKKQLTVMGSWAFEARHVLGAVEFLARSAKWCELFSRQVTHRFTLDQADEALATVRRLEAGKAVILP